MYKTSKGTTLIEVLVSVALISIVLIFVFNILADLKNEYSLASKRSEDAIERASYTRIIQNDLVNKKLNMIRPCSISSGELICLEFQFIEGNSYKTKTLKITKNAVIYDNEIWKLTAGEYTLDGAMICSKKIADIVNESPSLAADKKTEISSDISSGKIDNYSFIKIYIPVTSSASSNKKYNFEIVRVGPYAPAYFSDAAYLRTIIKCNN